MVASYKSGKGAFTLISAASNCENVNPRASCVNANSARENMKCDLMRVMAEIDLWDPQKASERGTTQAIDCFPAWLL